MKKSKVVSSQTPSDSSLGMVAISAHAWEPFTGLCNLGQMPTDTSSDHAAVCGLLENCHEHADLMRSGTRFLPRHGLEKRSVECSEAGGDWKYVIRTCVVWPVAVRGRMHSLLALDRPQHGVLVVSRLSSTVVRYTATTFCPCYVTYGSSPCAWLQ